jgi:hypothetical protein
MMREKRDCAPDLPPETRDFLSIRRSDTAQPTPAHSHSHAVAGRESDQEARVAVTWTLCPAPGGWKGRGGPARAWTRWWVRPAAGMTRRLPANAASEEGAEGIRMPRPRPNHNPPRLSPAPPVACLCQSWPILDCQASRQARAVAHEPPWAASWRNLGGDPPSTGRHAAPAEDSASHRIASHRIASHFRKSSISIFGCFQLLCSLNSGIAKVRPSFWGHTAFLRPNGPTARFDNNILGPPTTRYAGLSLDHHRLSPMPCPSNTEGAVWLFFASCSIHVLHERERVTHTVDCNGIWAV